MYNRGNRHQALGVRRTDFSLTPNTQSLMPILRRSGRNRNMTLREERQRVQRIQAGDRQAFAELLDAYETRVYRLALRFTDSVPDAEDVTQDIFLAVYNGLGRFRGDSALGTWIYRIAMNHCLEYRRKRRLESIPYDETRNYTKRVLASFAAYSWLYFPDHPVPAISFALSQPIPSHAGRPAPTRRR